MTKLLKGLYVVGVAAVLAASVTPSQAADLKCQIPFAFSVNNRALPPGIYDVSISQGVLSMRGTKGGAFVLVTNLATTTDDSSKLVFHRTGDAYVLAQAWTEGYGREVPGARRKAHRGEVAANYDRVEVPLL